MKHVGADNFILYALCSAATRLEKVAKSAVSLVKRVTGRPVQSGDSAASEKSHGLDRPLGKPWRPANN